MKWCQLSSLIGVDDLQPRLERVPEYHSDVESLCGDIRAWWAAGVRVVVVMAGVGSANRLVQALAQHDVPARVVTEPSDPQRVVEVTTGHLDHGAFLVNGDLVVITESDIFAARDAAREPRSLPSKRRAVIDPLSLKPGDYVVHDQHGIGRYVEIVTKTFDGVTRDYMVLQYASRKRGVPGDELYVSTDQLDHVTRYVGGEAPALNKIGGGEWAQTKSRARKAVRQIAGELIRLYAARMASKGHTFGQIGRAHV